MIYRDIVRSTFEISVRKKEYGSKWKRTRDSSESSREISGKNRLNSRF